MKPLFALAGLVCLAISLAQAEPPRIQSLRGLSPAERSAAKQRYSDAFKDWLNKLNEEERAAWFSSVGMTDVRKTGRMVGGQSLPTTGSSYEWRAAARFAGLAEDEITQLDRDKLLIEDISLSQSFSPYSKPTGPVFITSDSVLNGFHVLFEDSFRELEARSAFELREQLEKVLNKVREQLASKNNRYPMDELAPGWRHAQLAVGPALRLLGSKPEFFDAEVREEIEQQVAKVRAAEGQELPAWLGPPSETLLALDYRRFKPIGFYTRTESLQNYFRAVRWLQSIPFRANRDDELTAIGLLGHATDKAGAGETRRYFRNYAVFLGRPDDRSLAEAAYEFQSFTGTRSNRMTWKEALVSTRRWLLRSKLSDDEFDKLNDAVRLPPAAEKTLAETQFRVLSAYRLPDSQVLTKTSKPGQLPSGLAVATLLGSEFARRQLPTTDTAVLEAALHTAREDWHPGDEEVRDSRRPSLYDDYLDVLAALATPAEADAPDFTRGEGWAAKSCFTMLGSWAQMRHTFTLQAKENIFYGGIVDVPPGFVEPNPEFFRRMADLVDRAARLLETAGVFQRSRRAEEEELKSLAAYFTSLGFHLPGAKTADIDQLSLLNKIIYQKKLHAWDPFRNEPKTDAEFQKFHRELIESIESQLKELREPTGDDRYVSTDRQRWDALKTLTRRLEAMAHKQLRKLPWSEPEADFIRGYGARLAFVMGYFGNSWLTPKDDAPRWATVAGDPNTDTLLAVAVGRPRLLHVLYSWQGMEIHCTGAVMSYYEYAGKRRLEDEEWKILLDSKEAPALPKWIEPYFTK